ncbi:hypothetical protein [Streptomyces sp. NBC_01500]|uniref:hypothetical protein n=1 Tax=Streptomyces sp. NBC_01500 TaxID=2903886 RepID=UPI002259853D|nr:hypothetical protein [Streptomyces sp. NBC_01500]MCX4554108.1 hypothetical protein [Streptomyces sp. NBC_01500]
MKATLELDLSEEQVAKVVFSADGRPTYLAFEFTWAGLPEFEYNLSDKELDGLISMLITARDAKKENA